MTEVLRKAGLVWEPIPEEIGQSGQSCNWLALWFPQPPTKDTTVTLEEVRAALDAVGGKPLSEVNRHSQYATRYT